MDIKSPNIYQRKEDWKEIVPEAYHAFPEVFEDKIFEKTLQKH